MNIVIKVKPIKVTAPSKTALMDKITKGRSYRFSNGSDYYGNMFKDDGIARVFNIHKVNAKYHHHDVYKSGPRKGQRKPSVKVRDKQWIAYVYDFNIAILKAGNLRVSQNNRNFTIKGS